MNCQSCGAPMELFERRRYYFCHHCGSFHFIGGQAVDGLHVLERPDDADACPVCASPLTRGVLDEAHAVEHCERCGGLLMPRSSFAHVVNHRRAWAAGPPAPPVRLDARELERQLTCPACRKPMAVHPYYGPGNVVIDTCDRCDAVWVDSGELKVIADAPGRDRGTRGGA
jgi:Zn-finger nucleic acid-binding protein